MTRNLHAWFRRPPLTFRVAQWWAAHGWRGKAAVPRRIGRLLCRRMTTFVYTRSGAMLAVDPRNLDAFCTIVANGGTWDGQVIYHCVECLRGRGGVFYDIGANAGLMSIEAAVALGDSITVHAFEPLPTLARAIRVSAALNGRKNIRVHQVLLSDRPGETTLYVPSHSIHASIVPRERRSMAVRCRGDTIDNLVAGGHLPPPSVIKIDVEGAELRVFQGARDTIKRYAPVIYFECDENALRFGYSPRELCTLLRDLAGYDFWLLDEYEHEPRAARPIDLSANMPAGNYLAKLARS